MGFSIRQGEWSGGPKIVYPRSRVIDGNQNGEEPLSGCGLFLIAGAIPFFPGEAPGQESKTVSVHPKRL